MATKSQATRIKVNIMPERDADKGKERASKPAQCAAGCANSEHELSHKLVDEQFLMKVFW